MDKRDVRSTTFNAISKLQKGGLQYVVSRYMANILMAI